MYRIFFKSTFLLYFLSILIYFPSNKTFGQPTVVDKSSFSLDSKIIFNEGIAWILDEYAVRKLSVAETQIIFGIRQFKKVSDTTSCGELTKRLFTIKFKDTILYIGVAQFTELALASKLMDKYRSTWESIRKGKDKIFSYEFKISNPNGVDSKEQENGSYRLFGNSQSLTLGISGRRSSDRVLIKDLKKIKEFSDFLQDLVKFEKKFDFKECL